MLKSLLIREGGPGVCGSRHPQSPTSSSTTVQPSAKLGCSNTGVREPNPHVRPRSAMTIDLSIRPVSAGSTVTATGDWCLTTRERRSDDCNVALHDSMPGARLVTVGIGANPQGGA